ncbi:MAG: T9SS type A sorting domain-containing protein [Chlorobi bacterium]|nr:T9SS type A sorting domain-containing protein [Chlorobiota bacterium]
MKKLLLSSLITILLNSITFGQTFENINTTLNQLQFSIVAWGDYDNDNDLDLFLAGEKADANPISTLYINEGNGTFIPADNMPFPPLEIGNAEWADMNNDGTLDLLVQGYNGNTFLGFTAIYYNNGDGTFTENTSGFPQTYMGDIAYVDFDNDNDLDVAISGFINEDPFYISKIFENNGDETFTEVSGTNFPGTMYGKFKWADYNNDNYKDFVLTGYESDFVSEIYKNNGDGTFSNSGIDIHKGWLGDAEWADYNNDGNVDLVVAGTGGDGTERYTILYKNNGDETFTELNLGFPGISHGSLEWADFDSDNDLDLFISGTTTTPGEGNYVSTIYLNDGGDSFTESQTANLPKVYWGDSKAADYNNDGKPDILLSGINDSEIQYSAIFKNTTDGTSGIAVTFRVNMSNETVSPDGIHVAGSFQGWDPGATMMTDTGNGIFEYTENIAEGEMVEFKFINGTQWGEDESVPAGCAQNNNRFITVPVQDTVLTAFCFGSCFPCGDAVTVTFRVDMSEQAVSLDGVHIAGSFQGWDPTSTEMALTTNNIYEVAFTINAFEQIEYKFINGIDWPESELVPEECGVPDGFGAYNRSFSVPDFDTTMTAICFGTCVPCITGIGDNKIAQTEIKTIYPNPFTDNLNIEYYFAEKADFEIGIYNSVGKIVFEKTYSKKNTGLHTETITVANLPKGVYFAILKSDGVIIQTEKIVK